MEALRLLRQNKDEKHLRALIDAIPYAKFLGIGAEVRGDELTMILHYQKSLIGNVMLPAIHGGVIGGFLEMAMMIHLAWVSDTEYLPRPIDVSIDYLLSGRPHDTYARGTVTKHGKRVANVRIEAWQESRSKSIAAAHGHFRMKEG
ncbi:MAG: PaaI family thioesterase [Alphaproteobacteria bacterium]|nr:PaaI family thioesterase [Alphaproteobacteria bacterium]